MKQRQSSKPPAWADRLFRWYCKQAAIEDLHGDAEELFHLDLQRMSHTRARLRYWQRILSLMTSYAIRRRRRQASYSLYATSTFTPAMIKNYLLTASRNLARHKLFTGINVIGLAVGMSIGLLFIALFSFVLTYDTFHTKKESIYRVISTTDDHVSNRDYAIAPEPLAEQLRQHTGVQTVVRVNRSLRGDVITGDKKIPLRGYYTDADFLTLFTFPLEKGNPATALRSPYSMVLTHSVAVRLFGDTEALGKVVDIEGIGSFEITGIMNDVPRNSHMQFDMLAGYPGWDKLAGNDEQVADPWRNFLDSYIYMEIKPGRLDDVTNFLQRLSAKAYANRDDFTATFSMQSLLAIAPGPELYWQIGPEWGYTSLSVFGILTLLILLPACFNYSTLAIARSLKRMKEIGVRKVMGGQRRQIFLQFVTETVLISGIAVILAGVIFLIIRSEFIALVVGGSTSLDLSLTPAILMAFVVFAVMVGGVSGMVPAIHFSRLNPVEALKARKTAGRLGAFSLRKILLVTQFALSLGFIMSVVIVLSQYRYVLHYDVGFRQDHILDVELQRVKPELFRAEFSKLAPVQAMSMSSHVLGLGAPGGWVSRPESKDSVETFFMSVDDNFIANLGLTLVSGENFNPAEERRVIIVNEAFVQSWKIARAAEAVGRVFRLDDGREVTVIGVLKNFHYAGLREQIRPFYFQYDPGRFVYANMRVASDNLINDVAAMEATWKGLAGDRKFVSRFFDDELADAYDTYTAMVKICGFLGLLAITIACLGLLGMVVFTIENRVKEVGIRKAMGATPASIVMLLSRDFMRLMIMAVLIAVPVTFWFFDSVYLTRTQYYYKPVGVLEIAISISIMALLGLTTILTQTMRAARHNPVDSLRVE